MGNGLSLNRSSSVSRAEVGIAHGLRADLFSPQLFGNALDFAGAENIERQLTNGSINDSSAMLISVKYAELDTSLVPPGYVNFLDQAILS